MIVYTFSLTAIMDIVRLTPANASFCGVQQGMYRISCALKISTLRAVAMVIVATTGLPVSTFPAPRSKLPP